MLSLLNASVLIFARVQHLVEGSRASFHHEPPNWAMPSRCRPSCLVSREHECPLDQLTLHVFHLAGAHGPAVQSCSQLRPTRVRRLSAQSAVPSLPAPRVASVGALSLIHIHGSEHQHIRSQGEGMKNMLRYHDTQHIFCARNKRLKQIKSVYISHRKCVTCSKTLPQANCVM